MQCLQAVARGIHLVPVPAQQRLDHVEVLGLVIDAQYFHAEVVAWGHAGFGERWRETSATNVSVTMGFSM